MAKLYLQDKSSGRLEGKSIVDLATSDQYRYQIQSFWQSHHIEMSIPAISEKITTIAQVMNNPD